MKIVAQIFITFVVFIVLVNISLKVFNDTWWIGIGMGLVSIAAFAWTIFRIWKTGIDGKEKK